MEHIRTGDAGESAAAEHLKAAGYAILALKYRARPGEVDIVATRDGHLCSPR